VDKHAENEARFWQELETALGGRFRDGSECPSEVKLLRLAAEQAIGNPPTAEGQHLFDHLGLCAVCQWTYRTACRAARNEATPEAITGSALLREAINTAHAGPADCLESGALLDELTVVDPAPVLAAFADGSVRCLVGREVLLLLLESARADSSWGATCWLDFGRGRIAVNTGEAPLPWPLGQEACLSIQQDGPAAEVRLDWGGWGDHIRLLALARYPGDPEKAEQLLQGLEPRPSADGGWDATRAALRSANSA
jgi:hypothetical protein